MNMTSSKAVTVLAALAQETRLEIYRLLVEMGPEGLAAGEIGQRLSLVPATLSFHLRTLQQAGLVQQRREGRSLIYSAALPVMGSLLDYLTSACCAGDPESCGLPALSE